MSPKLFQQRRVEGELFHDVPAGDFVAPHDEARLHARRDPRQLTDDFRKLPLDLGLAGAQRPCYGSVVVHGFFVALARV